MQLLQLAQIDVSLTGRIASLPVPAILRQRALWTGKQVISHLLLHLRGDACKLCMSSASKTPAGAWGAFAGGDWADTDEACVVVRGGELLCGVLDKAAFGATEFGLGARGASMRRFLCRPSPSRLQ